MGRGNWTLGKLRMNDKEIQIMNVFNANSIIRRDGALHLNTRNGGSVCLVFKDGTILFNWLKEGEGEVI